MWWWAGGWREVEFGEGGNGGNCAFWRRSGWRKWRAQPTLNLATASSRPWPPPSPFSTNTDCRHPPSYPSPITLCLIDSLPPRQGRPFSVSISVSFYSLSPLTIIFIWASYTSSSSTNPEVSSSIARSPRRPPKSGLTNGYALDQHSIPYMPLQPRQVLLSYRIIKIPMGHRMVLNKLREGGLY